MAKKFVKSKKLSKRISLFVAATLVLAGVASTFAVANIVQTQRQEASLAAQASVASQPSDVFNLSYWKLTLPIDTPQPGDPDEIKQPQLATYTSQYFKLNDAKDAVTFYSPAGGDTTDGSSYARSELRERRDHSNPYTFASDCPDKDKVEEACWSTSSGYHIMTIDQKITHIPTTKPHVVVGQIHDNKDDVTVFRLEGKTLFVDANRYKKADIILTNNYQLGTRFTVAFEVVNDETTYYYNGQRVGSLPAKYTGGYFKAGMYVQSKEGKVNGVQQYGEVEIYDVKVCHAANKEGCQNQQPNPTSFPTPVPTATPVSTIKPSATPRPTSTPKPSATPKPTSTPKPTPPAQVSGKVTGITATSPKDSRVVVKWNAYSGASKYKIYMSKNSASSFKLQDTTSKLTKTFNLPSCKTNYFRVEAYDKKNKKIATSDIAGVLVSIGNPVHPCD